MPQHGTIHDSESGRFRRRRVESLPLLRYVSPMQTSDLTPSVYQLRVVIQGISPLIWRRLLIRSDMSLATLHTTLQTVLAWSDVYLHCFRLHLAFRTP